MAGQAAFVGGIMIMSVGALTFAFSRARSPASGDTHFSFVANLIGHWIIGAPIAFFRFERLSRSAIVPVAERT